MGAGHQRSELPRPAHQADTRVDSGGAVDQAFGEGVVDTLFRLHVCLQLEGQGGGVPGRGDESPGTGSERGHALLGSGLVRADDEDGNARGDVQVTAQQPAGLDSGHVREAGVEDDGVGGPLPREVDRLLAGVRLANTKAMIRQRARARELRLARACDQDDGEPV